MEAYPDIPAFTESVPEAEKYLNIPYTLLSFVVNNDTPQDVVDVLKAASQKVFADPEWTDFVKQKKQLILFMKSIQMMLLSRSSMITGSLLSAGYSMTTA